MVRVPVSNSESNDTSGRERVTPWLKPEEAAHYLGISIGTLRNWTSACFVPFSKRGRVVRYNREALDRRLSKGSCPGRTTIADI
jgi:excisionase family DNA binding protein